jgi:hypothetical protein
MEKYKKGTHPNSIKALEENRAKGLTTRQINKEKRLMKIELMKAEANKRTLDLELKIFQMRNETKREQEIRDEYEKSFYPLDRVKLNKVIKNITK